MGAEPLDSFKNFLVNTVPQGLSNAFKLATAPEAKPNHPELSSAITSLAKTREVIFLADSDHNDLSLRHPIGDPSFLKAARNAGITDLYIEWRKESQPLADKLAAGNMTQASFVETMKAQSLKDLEVLLKNPEYKNLKFDLKNSPMFNGGFDHIAKTIVNAHQAGIKVHFADPQPAKDLEKLLTDGAMGKNVDARLQARIDKYDSVIADDIQSTRKGKALVFYGAGHSFAYDPGSPGKKAGNIDDALRDKGVKTGTVFLTGGDPKDDKDIFLSYKKNPPEKKSDDYGRGFDIPDYIYAPSTGKIEKMETGAIPFKPKAGMSLGG